SRAANAKTTRCLTRSPRLSRRCRRKARPEGGAQGYSIPMRAVSRRVLAVLVLAVTAVLPFGAAPRETALDRYIHAPDPSYRFELVGRIAGPGVTAFVLDLTSQTWTPPIAPNRTVWKHWLTIVRPDDVRYTTGFLFLTGGSNNDKAPDKL